MSRHLQADALRTPESLFRSITRRYNPGVPDVLAEASAVQRTLGWDDNRYPRKVEWLQREWQPVPHFVLFDEDANYIGRAKHVMIRPRA